MESAGEENGKTDEGNGKDDRGNANKISHGVSPQWERERKAGREWRLPGERMTPGPSFLARNARGSSS